LLLEFSNTIDETMSNYDEEGNFTSNGHILFCILSCKLSVGAWPVLIDDFVEYARPKLAPKHTTV